MDDSDFIAVGCTISFRVFPPPNPLPFPSSFQGDPTKNAFPPQSWVVFLPFPSTLFFRHFFPLPPYRLPYLQDPR